jgi:hypothetical protein
VGGPARQGKEKGEGGGGGMDARWHREVGDARNRKSQHPALERTSGRRSPPTPSYWPSRGVHKTRCAVASTCFALLAIDCEEEKGEREIDTVNRRATAAAVTKISLAFYKGTLT